MLLRAGRKIQDRFYFVNCTQTQAFYKQGIDSIVSRGMRASKRAEI